jgi:polyisoprenoid-binding protein YceI
MQILQHEDVPMTQSQWQFDTSHATIGFSVRHMMVSKVHGQFTKWSGQFEFDEQDPTASKAVVEIDVNSINTNEPQRDGHLKSPDFFDAANHPVMTFRSTKIERHGADYRVTGDLTIRGTTRPVVLDAEFIGKIVDPYGNDRAGFSAKTSIDRKDFGLHWNMLLEAGGFAVADKIDINLEFEAVRAKAAAAA